MGLFGKKNEGGWMDVIRCDESDYLVWKWRPGDGAPTNRENAIRWGSSLRVKDGEVAVFVYKQESGPVQDYIEGPYDETLKTANFPVLAGIMGLAFDGKSPFQAEVYFINLAGIIRRPFRSPWFNVFDPRFEDFMVPVAAEGSYAFRIRDYKAFIKLHRLVEFDLERFSQQVRDGVLKYVKGAVSNIPSDSKPIPVLQLERRILEVNDLVAPRVREAFEKDFGVELVRFDISTIAFDTEAPGYRELREVTADLHKATLVQQTRSNMQNIEDMQAINAQNMAETLRIQRDQAERLAALQTQSQFIGAHQINQQTKVLEAAANNLGEMGQMNTSGGGSGGFNPVGAMTGLAVGGIMGSQMASMMGSAGQGMQHSMNMPPPVPQLAYFVVVNGQNTGPFTIQQLQGLSAQGQLTPTSYVWRQGLPNWELAGGVADLSGLFVQQTQPPPVPPMPPASGGAS